MSKDDITTWLITHLSKLLNISVSDVDIELQFDEYGIDSACGVGLIGDLGDWLNQELDPSLIYDYPSIDALSDYLVKRIK